MRSVLFFVIWLAVFVGFSLAGNATLPNSPLPAMLGLICGVIIAVIAMAYLRKRERKS
jgi:hypothetical protein